MNERIRELAEQAKCHADYYAMLSDGIEQEIFTEKFAELIVRECVSVAMEQYDETLPWGGVEQIKQHFGIKS